jgi:hypothetical protein
MTEFEDYAQGLKDIELEIQRKGIVLDIDWKDAAQVRALAREALERLPSQVDRVAGSPENHRLMAKVELFGLAGLMLRVMEESAGLGIERHGGEIWKTFARALWAEKQRRQTLVDAPPARLEPVAMTHPGE